MDSVTDHKPWTKACQATPRHAHDYTDHPPAPRQCTCGHRRWQVWLGGGLPPNVVCAKCDRGNKMATVWELGRIAGPREEVKRGPAKAPF